MPEGRAAIVPTLAAKRCTDGAKTASSMSAYPAVTMQHQRYWRNQPKTAAKRYEMRSGFLVVHALECRKAFFVYSL